MYHSMFIHSPTEGYLFFFFLNTFIIYLFIYLFYWLCWVFVSVQGLSLVVASGGHSLHRGVRVPHYRGLSLRSTGSRRAGSVVVAHGPSRSAACGILPDQGSNPCAPHRQADSQPLHHQGSPEGYLSCFQVLAVMHKALVNIRMQAFVWTCFYYFG